MTAQEEQMIQDLAERINSTQLSEKDPDAEQFLQQQLGSNPDAVYILAQTVLVQQYALEQAQKQLAEARAQLQQQQTPQPRHATSFLGSLLGRNDDQPRTPPPPMPAPQSNQQGWVPVQQYGPPGGYPPPPPMYGQPYGQPQPGYGPPPGYGSQSGGFLRSAMQTATGVAAGALAFEGIESLMHGFGGSGGFGSGGVRPEEIVNNYYGDSGPRENDRPLSSDIEDRRGESSSFSDAVDRDDHGSDNFAASGDSDDLDSDTADNDGGDSLDDDSNFDDGSSMDDSSGGDDSF